jgi:hypothetical protein
MIAAEAEVQVERKATINDGFHQWKLPSSAPNKPKAKIAMTAPPFTNKKSEPKDQAELKQTAEPQGQAEPKQ